MARDSERVELTRLDDLALPVPTLRILDVEGYEPQIIKGAAALIASHRPMIVFENWYKAQ